MKLTSHNMIVPLSSIWKKLHITTSHLVRQKTLIDGHKSIVSTLPIKVLWKTKSSPDDKKEGPSTLESHPGKITFITIFYNRWQFIKRINKCSSYQSFNRHKFYKNERGQAKDLCWYHICFPEKCWTGYEQSTLLSGY